MRNARLLRSAIMAPLMVLAVAGGAVAGPFEDAMAAYEADDYATALQLFRPLAAHGDVKAQYLLGIIYLRGIGVEQEYAGALNWLRKAADQGDAEAQIGLGFLYDNGVSESSSAVMRERYGIRNAAEAVKWYRRAADQGNFNAQALLGGMYFGGEGVPQDFVAAHMWYNLAAAHGDISSAVQRERVATLMTPAQVAEAQKLAREWKPKPENDKFRAIERTSEAATSPAARARSGGAGWLDPSHVR